MPATSRCSDFFICLTYVYVAMCESVYYECRCPWRPKKGTDLLELGFEAVWVLGMHLRPSARAGRAASHGAVSSAPQLTFGIIFFLFL